MLLIYIAAISAILISFSSVFMMLKLPLRFIALDKPNSRSLHENPTPRLGGIAILLGIILPLAWLFHNCIIQSDYSFILLALGLVAGVSIVDDYYSISFVIRIVLHIAAASVVVASGYMLDIVSTNWGVFILPTSVAFFLSVFFIVWLINLYNFMDGIDGLAGGMAVFGFGTFAIIGFMESQTDFAILNLIISLSSLGFLIWNYSPAKIFMGDGGSSSLGLLAGTLSIFSHVEGFIPIWVSLMVFSPFIVDATVTLIKRIVKKERFWDAHKSHYYQLMAESGLNRKKLVNLEYVLMLICSSIALITYNRSLGFQALSVLLLAVLYFILIRYIEKTRYNSKKYTLKDSEL